MKSISELKLENDELCRKLAESEAKVKELEAKLVEVSSQLAAVDRAFTGRNGIFDEDDWAAYDASMKRNSAREAARKSEEIG